MVVAIYFLLTILLVIEVVVVYSYRCSSIRVSMRVVQVRELVVVMVIIVVIIVVLSGNIIVNSSVFYVAYIVVVVIVAVVVRSNNCALVQY